jgi:hypothetical protein
MGQMAILGKDGDTKIMWNAERPDEVKVARETFDQLTGKGYRAYRVGADGETTERMRSFDPRAGKVILVPQMAGGI